MHVMFLRFVGIPSKCSLDLICGDWEKGQTLQPRQDALENSFSRQRMPFLQQRNEGTSVGTSC